MVSDDIFFAWLDGELAPDEAARVAAEIQANPNLAALAEQHRAMQRRLAQAFDPIADAPVPDHLLTASRRSEPEVVDLAAVRISRKARAWKPLPQWAAIAATLAVGIFVGTAVPQRSEAPVAVEGGKIYAAAGLDQALTAQLASAPAGGTRISMTFRDQSGAICRSFSEAAANGLACRNNGRWQVRGLFAAPEGQGGSYRMAGGMDPNLAALVDSTIAGEPFDAAAEKAAKAKGWR
ncbi:MAG TPA: anti-sigma factor [Sphingomicrobium sp.]